MTHDTKRSADVRARIARAAGDGRRVGGARSSAGSSSPTPLRAGGAPDDVERYFLFQTLVGAWPIELERIEEYMEKALREAKRNTNWVERTRSGRTR